MKNLSQSKISAYNLLFMTFVVFAFYSCMPSYNVRNQVNNYFDEYKNIKVKSLRLNIAPNNIFDEITNLKLDFYEEIGKSKTLNLRIFRNLNTFSIEQTLYLKTDDQIFKIPLKLLKSNFQSENIKTESTIVSTDSTGSSTSTEYGSKLNEFFAESFTTDLNDDVIESIKKTKTLMFRLYSGSMPVSFTINPQKLSLIKNLAEDKKI